MTSIKKIIIKLESLMKVKFPHFGGKFYSNRRNNYIHLGLDKSPFSFADFKDYLHVIDKFLSDYFKAEFKVVNPLILVISTKWKHDYIIRSCC